MVQELSVYPITQIPKVSHIYHQTPDILVPNRSLDGAIKHRKPQTIDLIVQNLTVEIRNF